MKISILQPGYLPWLGFFEQMSYADVFVIYDDVQYSKNDWRNRNRIKTANGVMWLTVPVHADFAGPSPINEIRIDNTVSWKRKHLLSIRQNYSKAAFYRDNIGMFEEGYSMDFEKLVDLDMFFINRLNECLGIDNKKIVMSSSLGIVGGTVERLISICKIFNADIFYEGAAGKQYIDEKKFEDNGIKVEYQEYLHPVYNQLYGEYVPYLSVIDLIFNNGPDSMSILKNNKRGIDG